MKLVGAANGRRMTLQRSLLPVLHFYIHNYECFRLRIADAIQVGLERTFRGIQAILQIISSIPIIFDLFIWTLNLGADQPFSPLITQGILLALRQRLAITRRCFKTFRFLDSFNSAHKLYMSISTKSDGKKRPTWVQTEEWIDVSGRTFNGFHFLLESITLIDALQIEGLRIWTPTWERKLFLEAQRFWLFALICAVICGLLNMLKIMAYTPVPATSDAASQEKISEKKEAEEKPEVSEKKKNETEVFDMKKELERLRRIMRERKKGRVVWRKEVTAKIRAVGRMTLANALDIILAGNAVGWVPTHPGIVGIAMFTGTIVAGVDVWEACGREVAAGKEDANK
jgi:hypothetical protein